tara:strand:+ start:215 stop:418 length:204 start_codon:yes stop_codon:yes gene_type:complete
MEVGNGISSILEIMNNLVLTKNRIKKAQRLHAAQLATFKKGVFTSYKPLIFEERQKQVCKEFTAMDS